ncbi:MAG TPA: hypothetical protein DCQ30_00990 [Acidimicrobiaceae bacterium]|nr:hypothetical protein [Acidimicrobiaceae bacterium]
MPGASSPLVSVVLPTYNRPSRLPAAIQSVLSQSYASLELLIVDDASESPVDEVVERTARGDRRVRLIRLDRNVGAAGARNAALGQVRGELVAFVDDDDRWEPHKLARQVDYMEEHPRTGLVSCDHFIERDRSKRPPVRFRGPRSFSAEQMIWVNFPGSFSQVLVRPGLLGSEFRIDESFECAEDWDLWLRCARLAGAGTIPEPLVHYVSHSDPRLTHPTVKRGGLERFDRKHSSDMSPACRAFHLAHQRMEEGEGWEKRMHVLRALATASPSVLGLLAVEQAGRQMGRAVGDPGLAYRLLARAIPTT